MSPSEIISSLKKQLTLTQETGLDLISASSLLNELEKAERSIKSDASGVNHFELEHYKATNASQIEQYKATVLYGNESVKAAYNYATAALRSIILINGGASVALLSLIGSMYANKSSYSLIAALSNSLYFFVAGVLISAIAAGSAYFTQYFYATDKDRHAAFSHLATTILVIAAYNYFGIGSLLAYFTFISTVS